MQLIQPVLWRQILRKNFTKWELLADFLELDAAQRQTIAIKPHFPLNLPLRLAQKIAKNSLSDPILRQFLATTEETRATVGFLSDPVGDSSCRKSSKLLHKYHGRVLLVCTSACAMHCRYCFRQNFDYEVAEKSFSQELAMIAADSSINEVILSGGDPLSLGNETLKALLQELSAIPHIRKIRFHTRFPMGIPERIDAEFVDLLKNLSCQIWFVIHANHPNEFDSEIFTRLQTLQKLGIVVLNQAVLLREVNDNAATLIELCQLLVDHGVLPYYLHQLDRVQGASHFEVAEEKGHALIREISTQLPGYAVPKYVREIAGEPNKTTL